MANALKDKADAELFNIEASNRKKEA